MEHKTVNHIVLISLDTLRGDCVGSSKFKHLSAEIQALLPTNPTYLDTIARKGIHFSNCYSAAPFTTASHASILTGMLPLHHGVFEYFNSEIQHKTLIEYASEAGYKTLFQTDFPAILCEALGFRRGVQHTYIEDENTALKSLEDLMTQGKTFSFFHFGGIHYPYGFHTLKFSGDDYRNKVSRLETECGLLGNELPKDTFDEANRDEEDKELLYRYKRVVEHLYSQKQYQRLTELYYEGFQYFCETRFRPFLERLEQLLQDKDNLIVIFGDHGEDWSTESKGHYKSLTKGVLNVPLIVLGSNISPRLVSENVRTVDIAPTLLPAMGVHSAGGLDGMPLNLSADWSYDPDLIAIAQVWLGVGKQELIEHIASINESGSIVTKMQTVLRGETAIQGEAQITRRFDETGALVKEWIVSGVDINEPTLLEKKAFLSNVLDKYNSSALPKNRTNLPDESVREQLRLMGYNL